MSAQILAAIQTYLAGYTGLATGAPLWVDYLNSVPTAYTIIPIPGNKVVEEDLAGNKTKEFPFALQSVNSTADDAARLTNQGFFEELGAWMESQTLAGVLPTLTGKLHAEKIEAVGQAFLAEQGPSNTAIYQIQCKLTYTQDA